MWRLHSKWLCWDLTQLSGTSIMLQPSNESVWLEGLGKKQQGLFVYFLPFPLSFGKLYFEAWIFFNQDSIF